MEKTIPANDSWAICRIFKKTNSSNAHQRAISHHSWVSALPEPNTYNDVLGWKGAHNAAHIHHEFSSESMSLTSKTNSATHFCGNNNDIQISSTTSSMSPLDIYANSYKPINPFMGCNIKVPYQYFPISNANGDYLSTPSFTFSSPLETSSGTVAKCAVDVSSLLLNMSSSMLGDYNGSSNIKGSAESTNFDFSTTTGSQEQCCNGGFSSITLPHHHEVMQGNNTLGAGHDNIPLIENIPIASSNVTVEADEQQWETRGRSSIGFPLMTNLPLPLNIGGDAWKSSLTWVDSSPCPSEMSTTRCYT